MDAFTWDTLGKNSQNSQGLYFTHLFDRDGQQTAYPLSAAPWAGTAYLFAVDKEDQDVWRHGCGRAERSSAVGVAPPTIPIQVGRPPLIHTEW